MLATGRPGSRVIPAAVAADVVAVLVFVAAGRRNHDLEPGIAGLTTSAAPFLIALGLGWLGLRAHRRPLAMTTGIGLWAVTAIGGLILRTVVWSGGTAAAFVAVTVAVTGALLVGWRVVWQIVTRSRAARTA